MKSQTEGELGKMQFLYPVYLNQENLNINFIKWNCPQHFHFSPLYVKTEKIHPENIIENRNKKKWNKSTILINILRWVPQSHKNAVERKTLNNHRGSWKIYMAKI